MDLTNEDLLKQSLWVRCSALFNHSQHCQRELAYSKGNSLKLTFRKQSLSHRKPVLCVQSHINVAFQPSHLGWLFTPVTTIGAGVFVLSESNFVLVVKNYPIKKKRETVAHCKPALAATRSNRFPHSRLRQNSIYSVHFSRSVCPWANIQNMNEEGLDVFNAYTSIRRAFASHNHGGARYYYYWINFIIIIVSTNVETSHYFNKP